MKFLNETIFANLFMTEGARRGISTILPANPEKNYEETELHQAFIVNANSLGFGFTDDSRPERITKAFFSSVAAFLGKVKITKADEAAALVLTDVSGRFKFAGIVEYHENEENPEEPGNWSFVMTFDEESVTDLEKSKTVKKYLCSSEQFKAVFDKVSYDVAGIQFQHDAYIYDACLLVVDTILQVLDREGNSNETVDIDIPGYCTLTVAVEDGEKVFGITPDGHLKTIIKDDGELEK